MAKFRFKLESLKNYRKDKLIRAKKEFSEINEKQKKLEADLIAARDNRMTLLEDIGRRQETVNYVKLFSSLVDTETRRIKLLEVAIERNRVDFERYRSWVEFLNRELKVVENLEEKQRAAFDEMQKKKERRVLDGWVVERWNRKSGQ